MGHAHGIDVDERGNGTADYQRLYQLIRQPTPISDRLFEIEFLDAGAGSVRVHIRITTESWFCDAESQRLGVGEDGDDLVCSDGASTMIGSSGARPCRHIGRRAASG